MGIAMQQASVPGDPESIRRKAIKALHSAKFVDISTERESGAVIIRARRQLLSQWTKTPITVTITPVGSHCSVSAFSSARPQNLISLLKSPSKTVVRLFLQQLLR